MKSSDWTPNLLLKKRGTLRNHGIGLWTGLEKKKTTDRTNWIRLWELHDGKKTTDRLKSPDIAGVPFILPRHRVTRQHSALVGLRLWHLPTEFCRKSHF
jgi:hypothetical protein